MDQNTGEENDIWTRAYLQVSNSKKARRVVQLLAPQSYIFLDAALIKLSGMLATVPNIVRFYNENIAAQKRKLRKYFDSRME